MRRLPAGLFKPSTNWCGTPGGKPTARPQYTIPDGASGKLDRLQDTSFNVWEYTEDDLMGFTLAIFKVTPPHGSVGELLV